MTHSCPSRPVLVLLTSPDDIVEAIHLEAWEHACEQYAGEARLTTLDPGVAPSSIDPGDVDLVLIAEADATPGPALLARLVTACAAGDGRIVDTRVLPVELRREADASWNEESPEQPIDPASTAQSIQVSGACSLVPAAAWSTVGRVWELPLSEHTGPALERAAMVAGLQVGVEAGAAIARNLCVDASGEPVGRCTHDKTPDTSPGRLLTDLHPASLPATSLHNVLSRTGITWSAPLLDNTDRPFLSIVTRTQGTRSHCLEDVLTCLAAQTVRDFEIVLTAHRVTDEQLAATRAVVDAFPSWLTDRVTVLAVQRPGRSAPLNAAFDAASGRYTAILDDDDTVFPHWVQRFVGLEGNASGQILRTVALHQRVLPLEDDDNVCAVPVGPLSQAWPSTFDLVDHLGTNASPCMTVAFPRGVFHGLGYRFDEDLDTLEDWDFLARSAAVVGVASDPEVTSVYRWWLAQQSSRDTHADNVWDRARSRLLGRLDDQVLLMPPGAVSAVGRMLTTIRAGQDETAALAASQHQVILQLDVTATEHSATADMWRDAESRLALVREKLASRTQRLKQRLELIRQAHSLLREKGLADPEKSIFDMSGSELRGLVAELSQATGPTPALPPRRWLRR